jgi:hypothetical protein
MSRHLVRRTLSHYALDVALRDSQQKISVSFPVVGILGMRAETLLVAILG